jgi:hypothetical protein
LVLLFLERHQYLSQSTNSIPFWATALPLRSWVQ